jgi:hypothetical protein
LADTVKLSDDDGVPYVVLRPDNVPEVVITGDGLTVMVKIIGAPSQATAAAEWGITVIVAVTGLDPVLIAVKAGILPVPLAGRPIPGVSFVHE